MACALTPVRAERAGVRQRQRQRVLAPSLVRTTLMRNGASELGRDPAVSLILETDSDILAASGGWVRCVRYPGLAGLFRKDRAPSKALGRALCDEVKEIFDCAGFLTTDELPRYGIGRAARRRILSEVGAGQGDCVIVYAYPEAAAGAMDNHLFRRLSAMQ